MKIIVIGASGTIGQAVINNLSPRHELITVGTKSGDFQADIADLNALRTLFERIGKVDGVVVAAGALHLGPLAEISPSQFQIGINSKLMGQVNVVQAATPWLKDGGSLTLTSGCVGEQQIRYGASASMVNAALDAFGRAAAIELPRGLRINVVSPTVLEESLPALGPYFLGFEAAPASRVALAYSRSVDGAQTGQVYRVW